MTHGARPLPEGVLPQDLVQADGNIEYNLHAHALAEIGRHCWIESERSGYDLGSQAARDWVRSCWAGWARSKLMEHLYGWRFWNNFASHDFALFRRQSVEFHISAKVLHQIATLMENGGENLDIISWANDHGHSLEPVLWLLDRIDINRYRSLLLANPLQSSLTTDK